MEEKKLALNAELQTLLARIAELKESGGQRDLFYAFIYFKQAKAIQAELICISEFEEFEGEFGGEGLQIVVGDGRVDQSSQG